MGTRQHAMWQLCGFSSRSVSEHRRLTDEFLGQTEGRRGVEGMPLCLSLCLQHQQWHLSPGNTLKATDSEENL